MFNRRSSQVLLLLAFALTVPFQAQERRPSRAPAPSSSTAKDRPGIPVTNQLVIDRCKACHDIDEEGRMSRISYMRKSPEGWEISIKRMVRLYEVPLVPSEAREMVRYLSNDHGLTRSEAARGLYEAERRVHWSEADRDQDLRKTCGACHTLGRVLSQQRDGKEWKLLKATHLAFFPLADFQAFRGRSMFGRDSGIDFENMTEAEIEEIFEQRRREARRKGDRADKVLRALAKSQPLMSESWKSWSVNRRSVPLEGTWAVKGHEVGQGDLFGKLVIRKESDDAYVTEWQLTRADGTSLTRRGKGLLYAGYSWRGRASGDGDGETWREVLLLNESWDGMSGRLFWGAYNEIGIDVELMRLTGTPRIFAVQNGALPIPSESVRITVLGDGFPEDLEADDFSLGQGVTVKAATREGPDRVVLIVDVSVEAKGGRRKVSFRATPGPDLLVLYDTVDYIKVEPGRGLSRVGGRTMPAQTERFEAWSMNRGPDGRLYTEDDYPIEVVPAKWSLEEFPIRENDDDVRFVGRIDPDTGVFTPALDGPNPERKYEANNVGEVYVVAETELEVRDVPLTRKAPTKPGKWGKPPEAGRTGRGGRRPGAGEGNPPPDSGAEEGHEPPPSPPTEPHPAHPVGAPPRPPEPPRGEENPEEKPARKPLVAPSPKPLVKVKRSFRARGRLIVTVPIYARWDRLDWNEDR
ncbi:MAG TPA: quinohemoprotein amine dehydrogenase subunit alpha [Planctomycetes bacterium]|nr:quinohemoprotein amine dehydrogenase subunit alpha [Planctomycetota bacterium]